jgi:hypothetical protein
MTIEGEFNHESSRNLLAVVQKLLLTSLKCATPGSHLTFCLKTRGKVDPEKIALFQQVIVDQPCFDEFCEDIKSGQVQQVVPLQNESLQRQHRNGLILVKGGTS